MTKLRAPMPALLALLSVLGVSQAVQVFPYSRTAFLDSGQITATTRDAAITAAINSMNNTPESLIVSNTGLGSVGINVVASVSQQSATSWQASISYSREALDFHTETVPPGYIGVLSGISNIGGGIPGTSVPITIAGNTFDVPVQNGNTPLTLLVPITAGGVTRIECNSSFKNSPLNFPNPTGNGGFNYTFTIGQLNAVPPAVAMEMVEHSHIAAQGSTNAKDESAANAWTGQRNSNDCQATRAPAHPQAEADGNDKGDPVLLHSGEVELRRVDLVIPGRGLDWEFARRCRSGITFDGPLGHNWEFNYDARLVLQSPDSVALMDGNGRVDAYARQADGSYLSPTGFYTRFKVLQGNLQNAAGGAMKVEIINRHGVRSRFEGAAGAMTLPLTRLTDRNGNAIQLLHEDGAHPARLTKAIDTYGRPILYLYTNDRLTTVRDFTGREIVLTYDANGDLVSVRSPVVTGTPNGNDFPQGKTEQYAYLNHNLASVIAPNEAAAGGPPRVQFVYDQTAGPDAARCLQQILGGTNASGVPAGGTITYQYQALTGDPRGAVSKTTVTDRNGNITEYFFDAAGRSLVVREHTRGLRAGDPAFYETDHIYNTDGELTQDLLPEGNEIDYLYTATSDRAQQGNLISEVRHPGPRGGDQAALTRTYAYEPVFNYLLSRTEERGNDASFVPQNGGVQSAARYTLKYILDYQEGDGTANINFLSQNTGRSVADLNAALAAAGMATNLPDQNGDGITASAENARGNYIRMDAPSATLLAGSPQALAEGRTAQAAVTTWTYNRLGQKVLETDPEENVHQNLYFPENNPNGDGVNIFNTNGAGNASDTTTGGYLKQTIRDSGTTTRVVSSDIGRDTAQNPAPTAIKMDFIRDPVGNILGTLNGRGVKTAFAVNQLNQTVQITRASDVSAVPGRNGGANGASEDLTGQAFGYREQFFFDFNDNVTLRLVENRDGNTPDAGAHPGFIEYGSTYDILDDLVTRTEEVSPTVTNTWQYRYDANQNKVQTTFPEGNVFAQAWDERDLLLSSTRGVGDPQASTATYAYDGNRNLVKHADGEGKITLTQFDGFDRPMKTIDFVGSVWERHYDPASNVVLEKRLGTLGGPSPTDNAGAGNVLLSQTEHSFDELSREYQTDRLLFVSTGVVTTRPVTLQDGPLTPGDGKVTSRRGFDRLSRVRFRQEDHAGETYQADFDGASRAIHTVDPLNNETFTAFDADNNAARMESLERHPEGVAAAQDFVMLARFDSLDRQSTYITTLGHTHRAQFDSRDNRIGTSDAQGPPSTETVMTTALVTLNTPGNTIRTFFDGINRKIKEERDLRAGGQGGGAVTSVVTTSQAWDKNSRLSTQTDDRGNTTTTRWDALNRKKQTNFADGTTNVTVYDRADNVVGFTDANGSVRTCTYDRVDRPVRCDIARGAGVVGTTLQTWEYDGLYRTTKAFDNNDPTVTSDDSVVTCAYDSLSRRLEEHQILGGNDKIVSSDWQDDDLRKNLVYPNGRKVGTAWDSLERLKTVTNVASYQYIGPSRLLERTYQNGTRLTLENDAGTLASGYDGDQRVVQLRHLGAGNVLVAGFTYTHDRMDNRLSEDRQHNALKDQWTYDSLYRVVDQKRDVPQAGGAPKEERAWTLDGTGNWTSLGITTPLATSTLTQSLNTLNSYTAFGGVPQADDLDGNRIDDGRFLYAWDFLHRLREVHCKTGGELVATYLCDAYGANSSLNGSGRRVRKTVTADKHGCSGTFEAPKETDEMPGDAEDANDPGAEKSFAKRKASDIRYLYEGMNCLEERNGTTDKVLRQYVNGARVNEHLTMDVYASDGVKLKGTLFYHEDAKGWIVALTDKTGKLKERVSYDAFGMPRFENAKGKASGNQTQSKFGNPYLYGGSYFDLETRLFLMGHRFYSPAEGRFVSRDPIGLYGDGINLGNGYGYVGNDGVNLADPFGLDLLPKWLRAIDPTSENFVVYRTMEAGGRIGIGAVETAGGIVALPFKGPGIAKGGLTNILRGTGEVLVTAGETTEAVGSIGGQVVKWGTYPIMQGKLGQEIYALPDTALGLGLGVLSFSKLRYSPEARMIHFSSSPYYPLGSYLEGGRFTVGQAFDPLRPNLSTLLHERIHFEQMRRVGPFYYPAHYFTQLPGYALMNISCGEPLPVVEALEQAFDKALKQVSFEREAYAHERWLKSSGLVP